MYDNILKFATIYNRSKISFRIPKFYFQDTVSCKLALQGDHIKQKNKQVVLFASQQTHKTVIVAKGVDF